MLSRTATTRAVLGFSGFSGLRLPRLGLPRLGLWLSVSAERARLRDLTDMELEDMGLSRADAMAEASRPFWDVPQGR